MVSNEYLRQLTNEARSRSKLQRAMDSLLIAAAR